MPRQHRVGEGQQSVDGIGWRTAIAPREVESEAAIIFVLQEIIEVTEIDRRAVAFDTEQFRQAAGTRTALDGVLQLGERLVRGLLSPPIAPQQHATVHQFGPHPPFGERKTNFRVIRGPKLSGT